MFWKDSQRLLVMAQVFLCSELLSGSLCGGGRNVVESQIDNRAIVFVTLYITAAVLRTRVLGPILGGIYCAIHGGDMCAVKKRGGRAYCEQCPIDGPNYYRPLLLMH